MGHRIYAGRAIALLTKHQKESVLGPVLEQGLGCRLVLVSSYDTDLFGTFSREIQRPKNQLGTALLKAEKAAELAQTSLAVASEGSFGSHPLAPIPWNTELVLFLDLAENLTVQGLCQNASTNFSHLIAESYEAAAAFAHTIGFPGHFLILRPEHEAHPFIQKDISDEAALKEAFERCKKESATGKVFLETDMRAHANPTRMENIRKAAENLVENLNRFCPGCGTPGFVVTESVPGLPCELCGSPTARVLQFRSKCQKCSHIEEQLSPIGTLASAQFCDYCNP